MSYVDAFYNRDKDIVQVVERVNGKRVYTMTFQHGVLFM